MDADRLRALAEEWRKRGLRYAQQAAARAGAFAGSFAGRAQASERFSRFADRARDAAEDAAAFARDTRHKFTELGPRDTARDLGRSAARLLRSHRGVQIGTSLAVVCAASALVARLGQRYTGDVAGEYRDAMGFGRQAGVHPESGAPRTYPATPASAAASAAEAAAHSEYNRANGIVASTRTPGAVMPSELRPGGPLRGPIDVREMKYRESISRGEGTDVAEGFAAATGDAEARARFEARLARGAARIAEEERVRRLVKMRAAAARSGMYLDEPSMRLFDERGGYYAYGDDGQTYYYPPKGARRA